VQEHVGVENENLGWFFLFGCHKCRFLGADLISALFLL